MNRYVVDASVAIKWFIPEIESKYALALLHQQHELLAPDLLFLEVGNVLRKKVRRGEVEPAEASGMLADTRRLPLSVYASSELIDLSLKLAMTHDRSMYDSVYVSLAIAHKCPLVSADKKLVNALASSTLAHSVISLDSIQL